jgi:hypothetical protein
LIRRLGAILVIAAMSGGCGGSRDVASPDVAPPDSAPAAALSDTDLTAVAEAATPTFAPEPTLDPLRRSELPLGVQVFESDVETSALEQLRGAGVAWARVRALWKMVEPERRSPPRHDWVVTDRMFGDTTAAGFRNVAVVYANPPWVTERECLPVPPEHRERYGEFWRALVERYDGDGTEDAPNGAVVAYWQVSNEVDYDPTALSDEGDYGGCYGHDPAAYAEDLAVAYRAAKAADPQAQVGFGPLAYDRFTAQSAPPGWPAPPGPFVYDFTQRAIEHLYAAHAGDPALPFFDFVGLHNYNDNAHFWDGSERPLAHELVGKVASFRAEQLALPGVFDLRRMPILISETGLPTSPSDEWTQRSEDLQAIYVGQSMVRALATDAIAAIWYTARDNIFGDCAPPHYDWLTFGLMRAGDYKREIESRCPLHPWIDLDREYPLDGGPATPRPSLEALGTLNLVLQGMAFDRQLTPEETGSEAIEAYRFRGEGGMTAIAAWTTTGERLGKRGVEPITATLRLRPGILDPWTGYASYTGHLGDRDVIADAPPGSGLIEIELGQAPQYLRPEFINPEAAPQP